jgi:hypothetical protein
MEANVKTLETKSAIVDTVVLRADNPQDQFSIHYPLRSNQENYL